MARVILHSVALVLFNTIVMKVNKIDLVPDDVFENAYKKYERKAIFKLTMNFIGVAGLFLIYLLVRIIYTPVFWKGMPNFNNWMSHQELINTDIRNLAIVGTHVVALIFIQWYWILVFEALVFGINWIIASIRVRKISRERTD